MHNWQIRTFCEGAPVVPLGTYDEPYNWQHSGIAADQCPGVGGNTHVLMRGCKARMMDRSALYHYYEAIGSGLLRRLFRDRQSEHYLVSKVRLKKPYVTGGTLWNVICEQVRERQPQSYINMNSMRALERYHPMVDGETWSSKDRFSRWRAFMLDSTIVAMSNAFLETREGKAAWQLARSAADSIILQEMMSDRGFDPYHRRRIGLGYVRSDGPARCCAGIAR